MPSRRAWLLIAALFLLVLCLRLPAAWVTGLLPAVVSCEAPSGTLWNGQCGSLRAGLFRLHDVRWQLLPVELLHAKLGLTVQVSDPALTGSAKALVGFKRQVQGYDLLARLPVPSTLVPALPGGWSGELQLNLPRFGLAAGTVQQVTGTVRLLELQQAQPAARLGGFEWQLGGQAVQAVQAGRIKGPLHDLGGPTRLQGSLMLGLGGEYELDARVAAAGGDATLTQMFDGLGPADAQGFHPLSLAGTL